MMGFGLLAHALAGGMETAGAAGVGAMATAQKGEIEAELQRQRAAADQLKAESIARLTVQLHEQSAQKDRERIASTINNAPMGDLGPQVEGMQVPPEQVARAKVEGARGALLASGDLASAANYDKITAPDVKAVPFGSQLVDERTGRVIADNGADVRASSIAANDAVRKSVADTKNAKVTMGKALDQKELDAIGSRSEKMAADYVSKPHPFSDPGALDPKANVDVRLQSIAKRAFSTYAQRLAEAGQRYDEEAVAGKVIPALEKAQESAAERANARVNAMVKDGKFKDSAVKELANDKLPDYAKASPTALKRYLRDEYLEADFTAALTGGGKSQTKEGTQTEAKPATKSVMAPAASANNPFPLTGGKASAEAEPAAPVKGSLASGRVTPLPPPTVEVGQGSRNRNGQPNTAANPQYKLEVAADRARFDKLLQGGNAAAVALAKSKGLALVTPEEIREVLAKEAP